MPRIEPVHEDDQRAVTISSVDPFPADDQAPDTQRQAVSALSVTWFVPGEDPGRPADGERTDATALTPPDPLSRWFRRPHLYGWTTLRTRVITPAVPGLGGELCAGFPRERLSMRVALLNLPSSVSEWLACWLPAHAEMCPVWDCTGEGGCRTRPVGYVGFTAWWRNEAGHPVLFEGLRMRIDALYAPTGRPGKVFGTMELADHDTMGRSRFYRLWSFPDGGQDVPAGV